MPSDRNLDKNWGLGLEREFYVFAKKGGNIREDVTFHGENTGQSDYFVIDGVGSWHKDASQIGSDSSGGREVLTGVNIPQTPPKYWKHKTVEDIIKSYQVLTKELLEKAILREGEKAILSPFPYDLNEDYYVGTHISLTPAFPRGEGHSNPQYRKKFKGFLKSLRWITPLMMSKTSIPIEKIIGDAGETPEGGIRPFSTGTKWSNPGGSNLKYFFKEDNPTEDRLEHRMDTRNINPPWRGMVRGGVMTNDPTEGTNTTDFAPRGGNGVEIRAFDSFGNQTIQGLSDVMKVIVYTLSNVFDQPDHDVVDPAQDTDWNKAMALVMEEGWNAQLPKEFINKLKKNLKINIPANINTASELSTIVEEELYRKNKDKDQAKTFIEDRSSAPNIYNFNKDLSGYFIRKKVRDDTPFRDNLKKLMKLMHQYSNDPDSETKEIPSGSRYKKKGFIHLVHEIFGDKYSAEDSRDILALLQDEGLVKVKPKVGEIKSVRPVNYNLGNINDKVNAIAKNKKFLQATDSDWLETGDIVEQLQARQREVERPRVRGTFPTPTAPAPSGARVPGIPGRTSRGTHVRIVIEGRPEGAIENLRARVGEAYSEIQQLAENRIVGKVNYTSNRYSTSHGRVYPRVSVTFRSTHDMDKTYMLPLALLELTGISPSADILHSGHFPWNAAAEGYSVNDKVMITDVAHLLAADFDLSIFNDVNPFAGRVGVVTRVGSATTHPSDAELYEVKFKHIEVAGSHEEQWTVNVDSAGLRIASDSEWEHEEQQRHPSRRTFSIGDLIKIDPNADTGFVRWLNRNDDWMTYTGKVKAIIDSIGSTTNAGYRVEFKQQNGLSNEGWLRITRTRGMDGARFNSDGSLWLEEQEVYPAVETATPEDGFFIVGNKVMVTDVSEIRSGDLFGGSMITTRDSLVARVGIITYSPYDSGDFYKVQFKHLDINGIYTEEITIKVKRPGLREALSTEWGHEVEERERVISGALTAPSPSQRLLFTSNKVGIIALHLEDPSRNMNKFYMVQIARFRATPNQFRVRFRHGRVSARMNWSSDSLISFRGGTTIVRDFESLTMSREYANAKLTEKYEGGYNYKSDSRTDLSAEGRTPTFNRGDRITINFGAGTNFLESLPQHAKWRRLIGNVTRAETIAGEIPANVVEFKEANNLTQAYWDSLTRGISDSRYNSQGSIWLEPHEMTIAVEEVEEPRFSVNDKVVLTESEEMFERDFDSSVLDGVSPFDGRVGVVVFVPTDYTDYLKVEYKDIEVHGEIHTSFVIRVNAQGIRTATTTEWRHETQARELVTADVSISVGDMVFLSNTQLGVVLERDEERATLDIDGETDIVTLDSIRRVTNDDYFSEGDTVHMAHPARHPYQFSMGTRDLIGKVTGSSTLERDGLFTPTNTVAFKFMNYEAYTLINQEYSHLIIHNGNSVRVEGVRYIRDVSITIPINKLKKQSSTDARAYENWLRSMERGLEEEPRFSVNDKVMVTDALYIRSGDFFERSMITTRDSLAGRVGIITFVPRDTNAFHKVEFKKIRIHDDILHRTILSIKKEGIRIATSSEWETEEREREAIEQPYKFEVGQWVKAPQRGTGSVGIGQVIERSHDQDPIANVYMVSISRGDTQGTAFTENDLNQIEMEFNMDDLVLIRSPNDPFNHLPSAFLDQIGEVRGRVDGQRGIGGNPPYYKIKLRYVPSSTTYPDSWSLISQSTRQETIRLGTITHRPDVYVKVLPIQTVRPSRNATAREEQRTERIAREIHQAQQAQERTRAITRGNNVVIIRWAGVHPAIKRGLRNRVGKVISLHENHTQAEVLFKQVTISGEHQREISYRFKINQLALSTTEQRQTETRTRRQLSRPTTPTRRARTTRTQRVTRRQQREITHDIELAWSDPNRYEYQEQKGQPGWFSGKKNIKEQNRHSEAGKMGHRRKKDKERRARDEKRNRMIEKMRLKRKI